MSESLEDLLNRQIEELIDKKPEKALEVFMRLGTMGLKEKYKKLLGEERGEKLYEQQCKNLRASFEIMMRAQKGKWDSNDAKQLWKLGQAMEIVRDAAQEKADSN